MTGTNRAGRSRGAMVDGACQNVIWGSNLEQPIEDNHFKFNFVNLVAILLHKRHFSNSIVWKEETEDQKKLYSTVQYFYNNVRLVRTFDILSALKYKQRTNKHVHTEKHCMTVAKMWDTFHSTFTFTKGLSFQFQSQTFRYTLI